MENLPISVIIAAKNAERTIEECLESVQRNNPAEVIMVDGNSTDGTVEIARRYTDRIYSDEGRGFNYAQQLGAERATQEYISYVDSDIIVPQGTLATLLAELTASDCISMQARLLAASLSTYWERAADWNVRLLQARRGGGLSAAVLRRDIILKYRLDAEVETSSDAVLELSAKRDGQKLSTSSAAFVYHFYTATLKGFARQRFRYGRDASRVIWKYRLGHIGFWHTMGLTPYWVAICLIKGKPNFIPYFLVGGIMIIAGVVTGFFELIGESLRKG